MAPVPPVKIAGIKHVGKRSTFTFDAKLNVLKEVDENPQETRAQIADRLGIPKSTLMTILKNRNKIHDAAFRVRQGKKRKRDRRSSFPAVEEALVQLITQVPLPLTGALLKEIARGIAARLNIQNFTGSNTWFHRFKIRNNIVFRKASGESADVSEETVTNWVTVRLPEILKGYPLKDQYNFDEFGLFFNLLPDESMVHKGEDAHGNKQSKARVTVLIGSNGDGSDKPKPIVIGKSKKLRCFGSLKTFPCEYADQKNAWMTSEEFSKFVRKFDARMRNAKRKVLLFIDNNPAHPVDYPGLTHVKIIFLPKNCTSRFQPMDHGVIRNLKHFYRERLVRRLLDFIGRQEIERKDFYINLLQAMEFLSWAWRQVKPETIENCFKKAGFRGLDPAGSVQAALQAQAGPSAPFPDQDLPRCAENAESVSEKDDIPLSVVVRRGVNRIDSDDDSANQEEDSNNIDRSSVSKTDGHADNEVVKEDLPLDADIRERWGDVCALFGLDKEIPFSAFVSYDDKTPVSGVMSAEDFADQQNPNLQPDEAENEGDDDGDTLEPLPPLTQEEGLSGLSAARRFLLQQKDVPEDILDICHRLESVLLLSGRKKQTKISDFFIKQT